jgi:hypothetical protein
LRGECLIGAKYHLIQDRREALNVANFSRGHASVSATLSFIREVRKLFDLETLVDIRLLPLFRQAEHQHTSSDPPEISLLMNSLVTSTKSTGRFRCIYTIHYTLSTILPIQTSPVPLGAGFIATCLSNSGWHVKKPWLSCILDNTTTSPFTHGHEVRMKTIATNLEFLLPPMRV